MNERQLKKLMANVKMSSKYGAAGGRHIVSSIVNPHENTLTLDDLKQLWDEQGGRCKWTNMKISPEDLFISHSPFAPSVDRIDHTKGYHKDNVVLTTRFANRGRGCYTGDDFVERMRMLLEDARIT